MKPSYAQEVSENSATNSIILSPFHYSLTVLRNISKRCIWQMTWPCLITLPFCGGREVWKTRMEKKKRKILRVSLMMSGRGLPQNRKSSCLCLLWWEYLICALWFATVFSVTALINYSSQVNNASWSDEDETIVNNKGTLGYFGLQSKKKKPQLVICHCFFFFFNLYRDYICKQNSAHQCCFTRLSFGSMFLKVLHENQYAKQASHCPCLILMNFSSSPVRLMNTWIWPKFLVVFYNETTKRFR